MKKFKLFASLSALCLCIAVLCMGIYAAQTVTYTISGTISYTVEDVFATISAKVFKVSGQQTADTMKTNVDTLASKSLSSIASSTYIDAGISIDDFDTTSSDSTSRTVAITMDNTYMTYYIVINIANLADRAINAQLTDTTTYTNLNTANKLVQNNIAKGDTKNLVVAFSLADEKVEIDSLSINYKVEVGYTEYKPTFLDTLQADTANSYWYVELGTLSDGTPIRWRVVSLNGEKPYEYKSTKPEIGTGTVFLQETYLGSEPAFDSGGDQNYYNSSIRTKINTLSKWNLTESDISSLIAKRDITSIDYYKYDSTSSSYVVDSTKTALSGSTSGNYFWLMDLAEANKFLGTNSSNRKWTPNNNTSAVTWWLRSPCSSGSLVCCIGDDGDFRDRTAGLEGLYAIRAAFQLA